MTDAVRAEIAPNGRLRAGINLSNMLLVTGRAPDGSPEGVAPDMVRALAMRLGVEAELVPIDKPGPVADAIDAGEVSLGLIAREPERAAVVAFSKPYAEIEATYLVAPSSPIQTVEEVDQPGRRIAVANRAAYDLYLKRSLRHAELVRAESLPAAFEMFRAESFEVLAGLRPALVENAAAYPGARVLPGRYTTIEQCIGTHPSFTAAQAFIGAFVAEQIRAGFVADAIARHGVEGRLAVALG
ncbi:MAG: transporter substrate-binding domain-containing protein [Pseudomonadota bacterium]